MSSFLPELFLNLIKCSITFFCTLLIGWSTLQDRQKEVFSSLLFIALGACLCMIASITLSPVLLSSPRHMLEIVMLGITLLGIVVIFRQKGSLLSIKQAGSIWFSGAMGLAVGAGLFFEGIFISGSAFLLIKWLDRYFKTY
jgi:putative Mg2+ transporter-C (MgtC) family protein